MVRLGVIGIVLVIFAVIPAMSADDGVIAGDAFGAGVGTTIAIALLACLGRLYRPNRDLGFAFAAVVFSAIMISAGAHVDAFRSPAAAQSAEAVQEPQKTPRAKLTLTSEILARPPGYEKAMQAPTHLAICAGGTVTLTNASDREVDLEDIPHQSDANRALGRVAPGGDLRFPADDQPGIYFLFDEKAGTEALVAYEVKDCSDGIEQLSDANLSGTVAQSDVDTYADSYDYAPAAGPEEVYVQGYQRADGTQVAGHYRTAPNDTRSDNWSTAGNINPHTGAIGTR